jgi:hypothetical protein
MVPINSAQALNGEIERGNWVIVRPDETYACLVGQIIAIDKLGTPEHDTENEADDVHVNFMAGDYSEAQKARLQEAFDHLYPQAETFEDMPLDDVIMAPAMLISLNDISAEKMGVLLSDYSAAESFCQAVLHGRTTGVAEKQAQLMERLNDNHDRYRRNLMGFDMEQVIGAAGKIAAVNDTHEYLTKHYDYGELELDYLLLFQNPLAVIADETFKRRECIAGVLASLDHVMGTPDALRGGYVLMDGVKSNDTALALAQDIDEMLQSLGAEGYAETVDDTQAFIQKLVTALEHGSEELAHIQHALDYAAALEFPGAAKLSRRIAVRLAEAAQKKTTPSPEQAADKPQTLAAQLQEAAKQVEAQGAQKSSTSRETREER